MQRSAALLALSFALAAVAADAADVPATPLAQCMAANATRVDAHACLEAERRRADDSVARAHDQAKAMADDLRRATGRNDVARALAKSQRAWQAWRDAECRLVYETLMPGTGAGDASLDCAIRLARERAAALAVLGR